MDASAADKEEITISTMPPRAAGLTDVLLESPRSLVQTRRSEPDGAYG